MPKHCGNLFAGLWPAKMLGSYAVAQVVAQPE